MRRIILLKYSRHVPYPVMQRYGEYSSLSMKLSRKNWNVSRP